MRRVSAESIFGPAALLIAGRGIALTITFVVPVILTRILQPADFGTYRQLLLVFTTLYGVAQLGMAESLFFFLPSQPPRAGRHVANTLVALASVGALLFALLATAPAPVASLLGNPALRDLLPLLGGYLALMVIAAPLEIAMVARKRHTQASVTYAVSDIARAALMLLPVAVFGRLDALLIGAITFAALRVAATIGYCHREFGVGLRPDSRDLGAQLGYALPLQLAVALEIVQANLHAFVIAARFDAATFAVYAIGCLQIPLVDVIAGSACNVMMVHMREHVTGAGARAVMPIWRGTTRMLALVLVPLLGVLWVVSDDLLTVLFTDAYAASVPVFRIWVLLLVLAALPVHGPLRVLGDTRFIAIQTAIKVGVVAVLIDGFLSVFGLAGGVLVSLVAMLIGKTVLLVRLKHLTAVPLAELLPWRSYLGIIAAAAAAAVPAALVRSISAPGIERVVAAAATYVAVYALAAWGFRLQRFSVRSTAGYPHVLASGNRRS